MKLLTKTTGLIVLFCIAVGLYLCFDMGTHLDYVLRTRSIKLATMLVVGISTAFSSVIFQTITNNKILTPSIMGYESVFILFQTVIVFFYGENSFQVISEEQNFFYALILMMGFSVLMYLILFGSGRRNIFRLLLLGLVLGTLFSAIGKFLQVLIDPDQFLMVQNFMFVSFTRMNTRLLTIASIILLACIAYVIPYLKYLDVIALGRDQAISLGINYNNMIKRFMLVISVLVSVSTALVGPITFLGILIANLTYELFSTRKHNKMVWLCSLISCFFLVFGQFLVAHVFNFSTTVSIVINFVGGIYFMYIILKSGRQI